MNKEQTVKGTQWAKNLFVGLLLLALAVAYGTSLGRLVNSPSWTNAVRLAGIGGVLTAILVNPFNGLLLWVILEPYQRYWYLNINLPSGVPDLSLSRLAVAFLCIIWVAQLAAGKKRLRHLGSVEISMLIFCIMVLPSVTAGLQGLRGTVQLLFDRLITPFLVFILAKNFYEDRNTLDKLIVALTVIGIYLCFMIFYEHTTGRPLFYTVGRTTAYTQQLRKIVSLLGNPAYIATVLAMIMPLTLYKLVCAPSPSVRAFYGVLSSLAVFGNFFCYNRGGWLALVIGLLILVFFERRYRQILLPFMLIGAVLVLVFWQPLTQSAIITERLSNVTSIQYRMNMFAIGKMMIRDHPLLGIGFDNFSYYYFEYGGYWPTFSPTPPTPHNTYLLVLTTMGLVAFIPYVLVFLSLFLEIGNALRRAYKNTVIDRALLVSGWAVIAAYAVSAVAIDIYLSTFTSLVLFCITGTILGYVSQLGLSRAQRQGVRV